MKQEVKNEGQGTVFKNRFLEILTRSPAWIPVTIYLFVVFGLLYTGYQLQIVDSFAVAGVIFVGAVLFWTFFEYIFHRYINHLDDYFPNSETAARIAYILHGVHHEYPRDKERLIMPPVPGLLIAAILYLFFYTIMGEYVYLFMPGFMCGYLIYIYIHYSTHKTNVPTFLKSQYRHHAIHHYKHPHRAFGVSTTFWDRVFGTMPPED